MAVNERADRLERAAVRRPEGDEGARVAPPVEALEVVPGDDPAHRVADEDELCVLVARRLAPRFQPVVRRVLQLPRRDAVVAAPVVRELEQVLAELHVERLHDVVLQLRVAVDLPEPWDQVDVRHHPCRDDSVAEVVDVRRVLLQLQVLDVLAE
jgi:hypothetical protein